MIPGEYFLEADGIPYHEDREQIEIVVVNAGDRPIQVGSHYHFFEVNRALEFQRDQARGFRLNIPAGTSVRFEPGQSRRTTLVKLHRDAVIYGFQGLVMGPLEVPDADH